MKVGSRGTEGSPIVRTTKMFIHNYATNPSRVVSALAALAEASYQVGCNSLFLDVEAVAFNYISLEAEWMQPNLFNQFSWGLVR